MWLQFDHSCEFIAKDEDDVKFFESKVTVSLYRISL